MMSSDNYSSQPIEVIDIFMCVRRTVCREPCENIWFFGGTTTWYGYCGINLDAWKQGGRCEYSLII